VDSVHGVPDRRPRRLDEDDRLSRRTTFDGAAERYARYRPTYPPALFDRLAEYAGLTEGSRVLEVAPGTGQATVPMVRRGWRVTAVELGEDLAAATRAATGGAVEVHVGPFEPWPLPEEPFDAVVCASAFHWLDPAVRLPKMAAALRPGGAVALAWTHHVAGGSTGFFTDAQDCYRRFAPDLAPTHSQPDERDLRPFTEELAAEPALTDVETAFFPVELEYTAEEHVGLLSTYSDHLRLPADRRQALFDCIGGLFDARYGGRIVKRNVVELDLARRRA
jgi:SAM-dependent methyltransferase